MKNRWSKKSIIDPEDNGIISFIPTDSNLDFYLLPQTGAQSIPDWYKKMPSKARLFERDKIDDITIKRCIPVLDAVTTGYFLVTNQDYYFEADHKKEKYDWGSDKSMIVGNDQNHKKISMHPTTQFSTMPIGPEFINYAFKWNNPWVIKTPSEYSCIFTHPFNYPYLPFYTLTGVVDTDNYFQQVLFPFFMKNNFTGLIPKGTPVVQIIPFKREDWKMDIVKQVPESLIKDLKKESESYESGRYDHMGEAAGGMYKRDYRKKKKYL